MEKIAAKRYLWFALSGIILLPGIVSLALFGLRLGIDFTGGSLVVLEFAEPVDTEEVRQALVDLGYDSVVVQTAGASDEHGIQIRMPEIQEGSQDKEVLYSTLTERLGSFTEEEFESISGSVGSQIRNRSVLAVILVSGGILLYMAWAFRNLERPFLYGACAILSMVHDLVLLLGVFSILGEFAGVEIDALFVTALLTVVGFSIHDKIVVFDRIRENQRARISNDYEEVVNFSIAQTMVRSINNSMTVVFTLLALYLFGGSSTKNFVLALLIGMISGTYSSIFTAAQLLVAWQKGEIQRFFGRWTGRGAGPAPAPSR